MSNQLLKSITYLLLSLPILTGSGCSRSIQVSQLKKSSSNDCSEIPLKSTKDKIPKKINLTNYVTLSGQVSESQFEKYVFEAQQNQKLNYSSNPQTCLWIYPQQYQSFEAVRLPNTGSFTIPKSGKFIINVSALKGITTFELETSLINPQSSPVSIEQEKPSLVYNVQTPQSFEQSVEIQRIVDEIINLATSQGLPIDPLSISLIDVNTGEFASYQEESLRYPASVVKMFWMTILYEQMKQGFLKNENVSYEDIRKMLKKSDNQAGSRIVDQITDTSSGAELSKQNYQDWLNRRLQMNEFFTAADYGELNISQKTFPIPYLQEYGTSPKGRELQMRGDPNQPVRNKITTQQAARLMYEIITEQAVSPEFSREMQQWLTQDLNREAWEHIDPNFEFNPIRSFFGESLPPDVQFLSKAGWTSSTRQEVAFVRTSDRKTAYILAIFAEDKAYAYDGNQKIFPQISRLVFERMKERSGKANLAEVSSP